MRQPTPPRPVYLSVVAPAFNEAENLPQLIREIAQAGQEVGRDWEIVIADDESTDGSLDVLAEMMVEVPQLRVLVLKKRSGQTAALDAALRAAAGQFIATLDSDLQNDPADIPRLLQLLETDQCDFVQGWRKDRQDSSLRKIPSRYGNALRNHLMRESIHDSGCGLKVFRRECIERMKLFNGLHRFFAALVRMDGFRVMEVVVNHRPRTAGVAKYGFWNRFFRFLRDAKAVRWMQNRQILYEAHEVPRAGAPAPGEECRDDGSEQGT